MTDHNIYLDHGATTPVHPKVVELMLPYWTKYYGNPSSSHSFGRQAESALRSARESVADLLNASPGEIVFTANGSASDNLAIRGVVRSSQLRGKRNHIIISSIEHSAVKNTAVQLAEFNECEVTILPVDQYGQIRPADLESAIQSNTILISIMAANNEIGTLQPIEEIGRIAREHGILFHTDAIQAIATQNWDMARMPIDLLSIAPHKFYGPKGIGILYIRDGVQLEPVLTGGGQEENRRAGTENVAFAVGAAEALRLVLDEQSDLVEHYRLLTGKLIEGLTTALPHDCVLTGHPTQRLPHNASFAFRKVSGNDILMHLDLAGIAASSGSACKTGDPKPSATLEAIGLSPEWTKGGLRLTVGRQNNLADIDYTLQTIPAIISRLQELDYAWD
ncbi:MAG: cysteine desulfurase family protein [Candidatus Promineifilaceae bacterium]|jgi:cysteine desulfurase